MHYGILFFILQVCVHAYVCLFTYGMYYMCLIICIYVCMCCRRRYVYYGILFPILQICVFVCVHAYVCLFTYGSTCSLLLHLLLLLLGLMCVPGTSYMCKLFLLC